MIDLLFKNDLDFYNQKTKKLNEITLQLRWGNPLKYNSQIIKINKAISLLNMIEVDGENLAFGIINGTLNAQKTLLNLLKNSIININKKAYEKNND